MEYLDQHLSTNGNYELQLQAVQTLESNFATSFQYCLHLFEFKMYCHTGYYKNSSLGTATSLMYSCSIRVTKIGQHYGSIQFASLGP